MSQVQLSVEEFFTNISSNDSGIEDLLATPLTVPEPQGGPSINDESNPFDAADYIGLDDLKLVKDEFDVYLPGYGNPISNDNGAFLLNNNIPFGQAIHNHTYVQQTMPKDIPLSQSIDIKSSNNQNSLSQRLEFAHGLEPTYKPRYKSDYFAQDGTIRLPRYVADEKGNHFITIKVPLGIQGKIRIDWVTTTDTGRRYSMPYKFQVSNDSLKIKDCNPMYKLIETDHRGLMKLYLVLIKSKQDELKPVESFDIFPPNQSKPNNTIRISPMNPKQLIKQFQLDKSQLAFTICPFDRTTQRYVPDWSTTIYSTVLTESSSEKSNKRKATCPSCLHSFEVIMDSENDIVHKNVIKKRKTSC